MPIDQIRVDSDVDLGSAMMEGFEGEILPLELDMSIDDSDDVTHDTINVTTSNTSYSSLQRPSAEDDGLVEFPESQSEDISVQKNGANAVTDFTRRRNWTRRILEEMKDMLLILSSDGRILYASPATKFVTNLEPDHLNRNFLTNSLHDDDKTVFLREFHESIATGNRLRFHFRFKKADETFVLLEASGHPHFDSKTTTMGTGKEGNPCSGFFLICRPYPTTACRLLDSFLEHKLENVRLARRIAYLKEEEEEEEEPQVQQQWIRAPDSNDTLRSRYSSHGVEIGVTSASGMTAITDKGQMLPPAKPRASTEGQDPSLIDVGEGDSEIAVLRMPSYLDEIEMLTGLRYSEGERSVGLSTGKADGSLVHEDIDVQEDISSESDKKKKLKTSEEYMCTDCGTLASPEWRKGPKGPKTLCNACGCKFQ